jgi:FixJ family two-component response regulator
MTDPQNATVIVIDDDSDVREALGRLLRSVGFKVQLHGSVPEFQSAPTPDGPACMVLDVRLPGQSGLNLQRDLASAGQRLPIVFITGHGDIAMSVQAMKGGAIEFLTKPFRDQDLLDAVESGVEQNRRQRAQSEAVASLAVRYNALTAREREVMAAIVAGRSNKQIAADAGVSLVTVKLHRTNLMRKMTASSIAELGVMAERIKALISPPEA